MEWVKFGQTSERLVLYIKNVNINNLVTLSDLFHTTEPIEHKPENLNEISLPNTFYDISMWPRSTKQHCFYCGMNIDGCPIPAAISKEKSIFTLDKQAYCCFEHRKLDIQNSSLTSGEKLELIELNKYLANEFKVQLGPEIHKNRRQVYGGDLTDPEYKKLIKQIYLG